ncbi:MAG TPA: cytochrome b [Acidocella sp.]|jgi:cytochrome b561|uniref:cytochrome b n=1 Tax=Acidocella sp. TaxID=50710 RepID=UPI002C1FBD12|nr:cytochrome b [Acidocella sp.]HVE20929.1 cytochrome b [Acidocella sp.]
MDQSTRRIARIAGDDSATRSDDRYGYGDISLHWLTALLVVTQFSLAEIWGFLPSHSASVHFMQFVHVSLGMSLAAILVVRLIWRVGFGRRLPHVGPRLMVLVANITHYLLYGLLILVVSAGFGKIWGRGHDANFFGLFSIASPFGVSAAWRPVFNTVHVWGAWAMICLAAAHAAAALFHHYGLKDGVLRRMLPLRHPRNPRPS